MEHRIKVSPGAGYGHQHPHSPHALLETLVLRVVVALVIIIGRFIEAIIIIIMIVLLSL